MHRHTVQTRAQGSGAATQVDLSGRLIAIGQQSGKPDRASRANEPIRHSRANSDRAGRAIRPVGPIGQPEQSGKPVRISSPGVKQNCLMVNRAIGPGCRSGQSGKFPNRASRARLLIGPVGQMPQSGESGPVVDRATRANASIGQVGKFDQSGWTGIEKQGQRETKRRRKGREGNGDSTRCGSSVCYCHLPRNQTLMDPIPLGARACKQIPMELCFW